MSAAVKSLTVIIDDPDFSIEWVGEDTCEEGQLGYAQYQLEFSDPFSSQLVHGEGTFSGTCNNDLIAYSVDVTDNRITPGDGSAFGWLSLSGAMWFINPP